jgi:leucyl aminopeptidase
VTTLSGKTIEVLNTDAEGRVVLADAITYAKQQGATKLIDLATLTGAILVSLADVATGAVTNDQSLMSEILEVSEMTDERIWQLPVYSEYKEMIKSKVADVKNTGGRYAGSITGGLFIGTFAENTPWVHLDIAGTAFLEQRRGINPKGGTGVMVRTLIQLLLKQQKETAKN